MRVIALAKTPNMCFKRKDTKNNIFAKIIIRVSAYSRLSARYRISITDPMAFWKAVGLKMVE